MNTVSLQDIQFPVYLLGKEKPEEEDGLLFYHRVDKEGNEFKFIVDDKRWHNETIGQRRLKTMMLGENKLHPITHTIYFISDLIKLSSSNTWFIDDAGKLFKYTKSMNAKLIIKPITKVIPITGGCIIEVEDIQTRFKCLYAPKLEKFAGILKLGHMYILYGLYENKPKDSRRRI